MSLRFARANLALWHVLQEKIKLIFQLKLIQLNLISIKLITERKNSR